MPKVKLPLLEGKGKYLQFTLALQEQTKDFTNSSGELEGDRSKLLQLIKEVMHSQEGKKLVGNMFNLDDALNYLNTHYNLDRNLANISFAYLTKIEAPRNAHKMYTNSLEIFHNMKILITLSLQVEDY